MNMSNVVKLRKIATNKPDEFVSHVLKTYQFLPCGRVVQNGTVISKVDLNTTLQTDYANVCASSNLKNLGLSLISKQLELQSKHKMEEARAEFAKTISYAPNLTVDLHELLKATIDSPSETDEKVFKHWLWQVKRKMNGLPVRHHIMPILFGPQAAGKSKFIEAFLSPLPRGMWEEDFSLSSVNDERKKFMFADRWVMVSSEMSGAKHAEIEAFKAVITSNTVSWRVLGTNFSEEKPNICTFFGCSNRPLDQIIYDPTGIRRFYQFTTKPGGMDREVVNNFDYLSLWKSIDENNNEGYLTEDDVSQIKVINEKYRARTPVEVFLEDVEHTKNEGDFTSVQQLFDQFKLWQNSSNERTISKSQFSKLLRNAGFEQIVKKIDGKTFRGYTIKLTNPTKTFAWEN